MIIAETNHQKFHEEFTTLTSQTSPKLIKAWDSLPTTPQVSDDGKTVSSVYYPDSRKGINLKSFLYK